MLENINGKSNGKVEINGHTYQTVAYRLVAFRAKYPIESGWAVETECLSSDDAQVTFKATIKNPDGKTVATGHAFERWNSSYINKTSAYENCETSAIGRALASAGFIGSEFASADEVTQAIQAQACQTSLAEANQSAKEAQPPTSPEALPTQPARQETKLTSQAAKQTEPGETQSQPKQNGKTSQAEPSQEADQPSEEIAEQWARENQAQWLDSPCPYVKAQGRTWRQLAENQGDKIAVKGRPCQPRAYLHSLAGWNDCKVWQRMKARVALELCKNGNGVASLA